MEKIFEIPVGMSAMEYFHAKMLESLFGSFNGLHDHETSILVEAMKRGDEESIRKLAEVTHSDIATVRDCNLSKHLSIIIFNKHRDSTDYINSIVHEAEHVKQAMLEAYEVQDKGEESAYTIGYLVMKMYKEFRRLLNY